MKTFFDIRTLSLFSGFISACLFICMAYIYRNRKTYPGFNLWSLAFMFNFIGFVLLSFRNILPVFFTVIVANTLIVLCYSLIARGLIDFADDNQNIWADISPLFVFIISFFYFSYILPNVNARIVIISITIMLICLRCAVITHRKIKVTLDEKNLLLVTTFLMVAIWFLLRTTLTISVEGEIHDFMSAGMIHGLSIVAVSIGNIFIAIGLIIINAQRLEKQVNKRSAELSDLNNELIDSKEKFRSLSEAAFEGIVFSENGIILEVNNAFCDMLGYTHHELVGMEVKMLVTPEERENVRKKVQAGYEKAYETQCLKKDGSSLFIEAHAKMFAYKGRKVRVTAIRDLTEQKKAEAVLRESERMEGVLEIAGAVCHELNQPLMAITGYTDLISATISKNDPVFDKIQKIIRQIGRIGIITQRLMSITKYETKEYLQGKIIDIEKSSKSDEH